MSKSILYDYFNSVRNDTYTIQKGDSLWKIAKDYDVTVDDLMKTNNLTSTLIYPNQVLIIPKKESNGNTYFEEYIVQPNDTLLLIESKTSVPLNVISEYNDLSKLLIVENQTLVLPKSLDKYYTITPSDTLSTILDKTGLTPYELIKLNETNWLAPNTTIIIK